VADIQLFWGQVFQGRKKVLGEEDFTVEKKDDPEVKLHATRRLSSDTIEKVNGEIFLFVTATASAPGL
jgi:hypothetical protein